MITFKFDPNQPYQLKAIRSVTDLFKQQSLNQPNVQTAGGTAVIPNYLELQDSAILKNLQAIQEANGLEISPELKGRDFSVEMETGTGKTYVYLRTILEIHREYGFRKFIIIVPSIAIREGVLKTLQITREHFSEIYNGQPYRYAIYQSRALSLLRQFALSNTVEILIMTIDSFNKDGNVIRNYTDRLAGARPIDLIRGTYPILILDEPQNMESEKARGALETLNPLFTLRYSATHRHYYNLVYRLTPYDAYRMGLVKQIEVYSITETANHLSRTNRNQVYISVNEILRKNGRLLARLQLNARSRKGAIQNKVYLCKPGDSLYSKTRLSVYRDWVLSEIDLKEKKAGFSNGQVLRLAEITGSDRKTIMKRQIEITIREHLQKRKRLRPRGIKNLTLFFIDRVDNYLQPDGWIRTHFEKQFVKICREEKVSQIGKASAVHNGYFSKKKTEKAIEMDQEAFDLIMRDKERLLSPEEPVEFIFSHSALREGWDNPNVFSICTLNYSHSQVKKRQEIGRGIRLCVNLSGERIFDPGINRLTVIANENYADYVSQLQTEYDEEYGSRVPKPEIRNARLRRFIGPKPDFDKNPHFKRVWDSISVRTVFEVRLNDRAFQKACVTELNRIKAERASITITKAKAEMRSGKLKAKLVSQNILDTDDKPRVDVFHVIQEIQSFTGLTQHTISDMLAATLSLSEMLKGPEHYINQAGRIIQEILCELINDGINYKPVNSRTNLKGFEPFEDYEDQILEVKKTIYPFLPFSTVSEKELILLLEKHGQVLFYLRMPAWSSIPTPYGKYRPDWALLVRHRGKSKVVICDVSFYSVADPRLESRQHCGFRHFKSIGVEYVRVFSPDDFEQTLFP
jgi:type III restriction enzyme